VTTIVSAVKAEADDLGLAATGHLEPCLKAALDGAFASILTGLTDDQFARGLEKAKQVKIRLARQGDPSGRMSGDGICVDEEDNNAPTAERATKSEFEIVSTSHSTGRDRSHEAWRVVPIIERMRRNGQITDEEYRAAQLFHKYFILGHRVGGLTMRYGELTGAGGTPPGQQVDQINARGDVRMAPDELRAMYNGLWSSGVKALLTTNPLGTDRFIATWVQRIACEDYSVLEDKVPTLTDCGMAYMGTKKTRPFQTPHPNVLARFQTGAAILEYRLPRHGAINGGNFRAWASPR
jgi:hypothetical protein